MFKCRVILANAKAFQDLFWDVMKAKHGTAFAVVAPQGRKGDGGNDGYLPIDGHYYQIFAPVDPKDKAAKAASKLADDFAKVKAQWGKPPNALKKYSFAFNDKFEGAPKDIEIALNDLRAEHKDVTFAQYCGRDLETDFMGLPEAEWDRIVGMPVPDPVRVAGLDYSVLGEVIRFILSSDAAEEEVRLDLPPELDEKINLIDLSSTNAALIKRGAMMTGHVEKYIKNYSAFALAELRDRVVAHYETAKAQILQSPPSSGSVVDAVFFLFRRSLVPRGATVAALTAVDAIVGYFFEACDVFDPKAERGSSGASP
jgi:hypothetical protein